MLTIAVGQAGTFLRGWVRRRPVTAFCVWVFGLGWPIGALPVLVDHGGLDGPRLPTPVVVLLITYAVMLPAALVATACTDGREGLRRLLARARHKRIGGRRWLLVILGLPALTLVLGVALGGTVAVDPARLAGDVASVLVALVLVHLAEELVWAGFVQSTLARRTSVIRAAVLTAAPFAAIHLPLLLLGPVTPGSVLVDVAGLSLLAVLLRLLVAVGLELSAGSVLVAAVLHAGFNASNNPRGPLDHLLAGIDQGIVGAASAALVVGLGLSHHTRDRRTHPSGNLNRDETVPGSDTSCIV